MHILGFDHTTLLDFPGNIAATIFLGGCNLRCPFCHNAGLLHITTANEISYVSVLSYLKKRSNILEGVCITGGEPTLNPDLPMLIQEIKDLGLRVKLDTNGTNPMLLEQLLHDSMLDYVAMDIKNSKQKYSITCGKNINLDAIEQSITLLKQNTIPYEFRTTVVKGLHNYDDFKWIGEWLKGECSYFLQNYVESQQILLPHVFSAYSMDELHNIQNILLPYLPHTLIRGLT